MSKRYTTLPSISAEISAFVELCVINNPSSSDESIVFLNPGISAEISAFVELCVTRCFREAYTGLPVVRATENQKALNCVVLKYSIPVSEE